MAAIESLQQKIVRHRDKWFYAVYGALALAVLLPMLTPGYILTLDMVFVPHLQVPDGATNTYLFRAMLHWLNLILPSQVIEKLLLFFILFLSGVGMHRLMLHMQRKPRKTSAFDTIGAYFAGGLYMINPFTYDRFMTGQYNVLLGYALLPFFVRTLLRFLVEPKRQSLLPVCIYAVLISVVSIHTIGLTAVLAIVATGVHIWQKRRDTVHLRKLLALGLAGIAIFVVASSYWLIPVLRGTGTTAEAIASFRTSDQSAFGTVGGSIIGKLGNVLRLQGFWAEDRDLYLLPRDQLRIWGLVVLVVWLLIIIGAIAAFKSDRTDQVLLFGVAAIAAIILASGRVNGWLDAHVPFFAGYREPQKFVALVALAYAYFAGRGAAAVLERYKKLGNNLAFDGLAAALALVLIGFTPTMYWGFDGQLTPRQYPADWFAMNDRLNADNDHFQVLFVPWHLYSHFRFAGRIIASPATNFFDKPTIISDDPEYGNVPPAVFDPLKQELTKDILPSAPDREDLGARLANLNVKYVLLAKEFDAGDYVYLDQQKDLQLITESSNLKLYLNEEYRK